MAPVPEADDGPGEPRAAHGQIIVPIPGLDRQTPMVAMLGHGRLPCRCPATYEYMERLAALQKRLDELAEVC